jgi:3-dehydroquinate synthase
MSTGITIPVSLARHRYDVKIGNGLLSELAAELRALGCRQRVPIVADSALAQPWLEQMRSELSAAGFAPEIFLSAGGEASKSWAELERLTNWLLATGVERSDYIIAFGGGVIGDLTGFAAAIVKRGCRFVQIPTTLLAQVDSSVGGKTAINTAAGKNLIGAFHQPDLVLIDPLLLDTLPPREMRAGYAEVVKYGLIDDAEFFGWCEAHGPQLLAREPDALSHAIATSVAAKARIVAADETERTGVRALLNLGHTFGHALEAETGFGSALLHGEAVAAGMALAFGYSVQRGECNSADAARVSALLRRDGLPYDLASAGVSASGERLTEHMRHDKKMAGGHLPFLLARGIGQSYLASDVALADVAAYLDSLAA